MGAHWLSWGSWIWCEHESCLFPGCFGGYHLVKRWGWRWRGCGQCLVWAGASPLLIHQSQLLVCGWGPHCWSRSSDHWVWAGSVSSKCWCVAHSHLFPLPQGFWAGAVAGHSSKVWDRFMTVMTAPLLFRSRPVLSFTTEPSLGCSSPRPSIEVHCEACRAGAGTCRLGWSWETSQHPIQFHSSLTALLLE